jgi:holo-[acyl-carrier protein] synthase
MIAGIGIDIIELSRVRRSYTRLGDRFVEKILTPKEREIFKTIERTRRNVEFLAGRFCAKEAYMKATGKGMSAGFHAISVLNRKSGEPYIETEEPSEFKIHLSISHTKEYAVAQVVLERV